MPLSVISPVIATSALTLFPVIAEMIAVVIVTPALGPSLGTAPSGICKCMSFFSKNPSSTSYSFAMLLTRLFEIPALSFITSPIFPVSVSTPFPGIIFTSILKVSPPTLVHASPVTIPTCGSFSTSSCLTFSFPRYLPMFFSVILKLFLPSSDSLAHFLQISPILLERFLTPASLV